MVPDIVPAPPPPPMPSANYVPLKIEFTTVKSDKSPSPPRNPIATGDSFDSVINEIKNKGGTLRKTKRKEVVPLEECFTTPAQNLKPVTTAKPIFKNEIVVNIVPNPNVINLNNSTDTTDNSKVIPTENGTTFKLKRPSAFLNGTKPELPANREVLKPQLAPKISVNGTDKSTINGTATANKKFDQQQKASFASKVSVLTTQPPQRKSSLVNSTIQRLTSVEPPDSPTETPFKRNHTLTRSTSGGISSTIEQLERQNSTGSESSSNDTTKKFQRSNSVRQRIDQMNKVGNQTPAQIKDGTQTVGRRPMVPRPYLPRPSNGTMKLLHELNNPSVVRATHHQNATDIKLENEEARVGTTVNVADLKGTVTAGDPNVKKLVYNTYRNLLGAYNNKANVVVSNQNDAVVMQDRGVAEQLEKISQNGNLKNLTGRSIQKTDD